MDATLRIQENNENNFYFAYCIHRNLTIKMCKRLKKWAIEKLNRWKIH